MMFPGEKNKKALPRCLLVESKTEYSIIIISFSRLFMRSAIISVETSYFYGCPRTSIVMSLAIVIFEVNANCWDVNFEFFRLCSQKQIVYADKLIICLLLSLYVCLIQNFARTDFTSIQPF